MEKIINQIKQLKKIQPEKDFIIKSRRLIFATPQVSQNNFYSKIYFIVEKFGVSVSMALVVIIMILIIGEFESAPPAFTGLDSVNQEAETLNQNINITLNEIHNFTETARKTNLVLNQATKDILLNEGEDNIDEEIRRMKLEFEQNQDIEKLLNEAIL
ncbi:MAG: hypothetical protein KY053_01915 [Candidatus Liptonbacteria bacterium]|nr:hypothetical protein [Candidatus Liptonbacteria bacterium]